MLTPIFTFIIIWFLVLKKTIDDQKEKSENIPTLNQLYILLFIAVSEYLSQFQVPGGCLFRVQDKETRITYFLYSSGGSKAAYAIAGIVYDWTERLVFYSLNILIIKTCIVGTPVPEIVDLGIVFFYTLYDMTKILINFHTFSYLFDKKTTLQKFGGLLSFLLYIIEIIPVSISLAFFDSENLGVISRLSFIRSGINLLVPLIPEGSPWVDEKRKTNIAIHGDLLTNALIMTAHLVFALLLVIFIDSRASRIRQKSQAKEERVVGEDLRNLQELKNEERYLETKVPKVSVSGLEKAYPNKFIAASNINFGVEDRQLFTLLGPNGAGKTSVLEVLSGIIPRTQGYVLYENEPMDVYNNKRLSFCLQKNYLWECLTFREHLEIVGRWRGLDEQSLNQLIQEIDVSLQLDKNLNIKANKLSGGNKRKLNTVLALMAAPHIYILDEPTAGMDPVSRRYFWNIMKGWKESSKCSIILTTHTANEAEVVIADEGTFRQSGHHAERRDDPNQHH